MRARDREIERENEGANETFTLQFESAVGALHQFINVSKVNTYIIHWWQQTSATLYIKDKIISKCSNDMYSV